MIFDWPDGPDFAPINGSFRLTPLSSISASPYTGAVKSVALALLWVARFEIALRTLQNAHDFQGFIEQLEGSSNPVRLFDRWRPVPALLSSSISGFSDGTFFTDGTGFTDGWAPLVLVAATKGSRAVAIEGLPASQECFRRGDLIGIGASLYEVRAGVTSNSSGQALINILPGLRAGVAPGDAVTLWKPRIAMRLISGSEFEVFRSNKNPGHVELSFVEDVA